MEVSQEFKLMHATCGFDCATGNSKSFTSTISNLKYLYSKNQCNLSHVLHTIKFIIKLHQVTFFYIEYIHITNIDSKKKKKVF